jgi:hypothetical protein
MFNRWRGRLRGGDEWVLQNSERVPMRKVKRASKGDLVEMAC